MYNLDSLIDAIESDGSSSVINEVATSRRHFVEVAKAISKHSMKPKLTDHFLSVFRSKSPSFDVEKFKSVVNGGSYEGRGKLGTSTKYGISKSYVEYSIRKLLREKASESLVRAVADIYAPLVSGFDRVSFYGKTSRSRSSSED